MIQSGPTISSSPEPRESSVKPSKDETGAQSNNALYLSAVTIVAIIAITIISMSASANSSAVIGLMSLATAAVGGMAGVAYQKRQD